MELNIYSLLYLFFRLAPFIIVCFFSLQSVFNQDLKGIIYLVGLIFACFFTTLVGSIPGFQSLTEEYGEKMPAQVKQVCRLVSLSNGAPLSNLPLGQTVLAYTFIYLVYVIAKYKLVMQNIPTLVIFPVLIIADYIWNISNNCSNIAILFLSMVLGGGIGALWAYIIDSTGKVDLQLFNGISSKAVCSRPTRQIMRCRTSSSISTQQQGKSDGGGGDSKSTTATTTNIEQQIAKYLNTTPVSSSTTTGK